MNAEFDHDPKVPLRLVEGLRRLSKISVFVPPAVDERVLGAARSRADQFTKRSETPQPAWLWLAAAAAVVIAAFLIGTVVLPTFMRRSLADGDVNRDGQVDILDAFALARWIEARAKLEPRCDLNRDGAVDYRDVEAIAARAVQLAESSRPEQQPKRGASAPKPGLRAVASIPDAAFERVAAKQQRQMLRTDRCTGLPAGRQRSSTSHRGRVPNHPARLEAGCLL